MLSDVEAKLCSTDTVGGRRVVAATSPIRVQIPNEQRPLKAGRVRGR